MSGLRLSDVTVERGAGPVIADVSLTVEPGAITTIVGPNGAGKTSLLESISGVLTPARGQIELDGTDITRMSRGGRFRHGLVHVEQGRAIFPSLTVAENLRLTCGTRAAVDAAIEPFPELQSMRDTVTGLLSGGQQQMVVLARSIAAKPQYLLVDEMSLGLAPVVFTRLLPVVEQIAADGCGVLLVEQFTQIALGLAREALVVSGGTVTYQGPTSALLDDEDLLHRAYLGGRQQPVPDRGDPLPKPSGRI